MPRPLKPPSGKSGRSTTSQCASLERTKSWTRACLSTNPELLLALSQKPPVKPKTMEARRQSKTSLWRRELETKARKTTKRLSPELPTWISRRAPSPSGRQPRETTILVTKITGTTCSTLRSATRSTRQSWRSCTSNGQRSKKKQAEPRRRCSSRLQTSRFWSTTSRSEVSTLRRSRSSEPPRSSCLRLRRGSQPSKRRGSICSEADSS